MPARQLSIRPGPILLAISLAALAGCSSSGDAGGGGALPTLAPSGTAFQTEGGPGTTATLSVVVDVVGASTRTITVDWTVTSSGAAPGVDYEVASGTLSIAPGAVTGEASITVLGDGLDEDDEGVTFHFSNPVNATLGATTTTLASILDDDPTPTLTIASASVVEGAAAASTPVTLDVTLSAASGRTVTVDWATAGGTAASGVDFSAGSGTLTFDPGITTRTLALTVNGDDTVEPDETFTVVLSGPTSASLAGATGTVTVTNDDAPAIVPQALNDTGVTTCASSNQRGLACPVATAPGQDAEHGRDVTANDSVDGDVGFSFVKLDAAGAPLADQAVAYATTPWPCVRDAVTGLTWEVKTTDNGLHDVDWFYSWYGTDAATNGGQAGTSSRTTAPPAPADCLTNGRCDTQKFVADVNAAGWCGATDWRLPSAEELHSISHLGRTATPYLDTFAFPTTLPGAFDSKYWSSTTWGVPGSTQYAVGYDFAAANDGAFLKSSTQHVILVRGP